MEWFYCGLAGIRQAADSKAYGRILIEPQIVGGITHVRAEFRSPAGPIGSEWKISGGKFHLSADIPVNTTAEIRLPPGWTSDAAEGGRPLSGRTDLKARSGEGDVLIIETGSGHYEFEAGRN